MSLGYELEQQPPRLIVFDEQHRRLTDTDAIDRLFAAGHQFEAAAAHPMIVEGLTTQYLVLHSHVRRQKMVERSGRPARLTGKITFGRAVGLLISSNVLHSPSLPDDLNRYVATRNTIAHELVGSSADVNLTDFMALGRRLVSELAPYICGVVEKANATHAAKRT